MGVERGHDGARQFLTTEKRLRKRQVYCQGPFVGQCGRAEPQVTFRLHDGSEGQGESGKAPGT